MISDEIELGEIEQFDITHLDDSVVDAILYIAKDLICRNGMDNVYAEDIQEVIQENWG